MHGPEPDPAILQRLADEMRRAPSMVLEHTQPERIFGLVAMLQLALRHPGLDETGPGASMHARCFIQEALEFYRDYPTITQVIRMGFDS